MSESRLEERKRLAAEAQEFLRKADKGEISGNVPIYQRVCGMMLALVRALLQAEAEIGHFRATIRELEGLMHEQKQEIADLRLQVGAWQEAVKRVRSAYPESVFRPGPPYHTKDAESADWARRVSRNVEAYAAEIYEASKEGE